MIFRRNWGENRVYFHDDEGRLASLPASWTDILPPDVFVLQPKGHSPVRLQDPVEQAHRLDQLQGDGP